MDPYLERHWRDVHADFVSWIRRMLNDCLPGDLVARMEERVVIDDYPGQRQRAIFPDVRVYEEPAVIPTSATPAGATGIAEPILLEFEQEEHTETYVTILSAEDGNLITVIEFLSPTNKRSGHGRDEYRRKRDELAQANVNLVEIDLIREGSWRELLLPVLAPPQAETPYRVLVRRSQRKHRIELYPITLNKCLPLIPVPLRAEDDDVVLDLQTVLQNVYAGGRYDHTDYRRPCQPPLQGDDADWADELLRKAGRR